ncbi:hypothetical protein MTO96_014788 [Rhipicephalus appendiculatus]
MHLGVIEMASLDALPGTNPSSAAAASSSWASRKAAAVFKAAATARSAAAANSSSAGSSDVSAKTIISVFVVLGVFLVVSVVGAAVTFVETQAKDARNHNHSSPCVEYIQFAPNETLLQSQQGSEQPPESLPSSPARLEEQTPSQTPASTSKDVKVSPTSQNRGVYAGEASNNGTFSLGRILDALAAGKDIRTGADHL